MKRIIGFLLMTIIISTLMTLRNPYVEFNEIKDLVFVRNIGVDLSNSTNKGIVVTINSKHETSTSGEGQGKIVTNTLSESGETLFEAVRKISTFSDSIPYWAHTEFFIMGEDAAKEGLFKYFDFIVRQQLIRLDTRVIVVKDASAEKLLSTTSTETTFTSERMNILFEQVDKVSISGPTDLEEIVKKMNEKYSPICIPYVVIDKKIEKDEAKNDMVLEGYAVFKGYKLFDFIEGNLSKAYNIINGKFESDIYVVKDTKKHKVSLEVTEVRTDIEPRFEEDGLSFIINIEMKSNIGEHEGPEFIAYNKQLDYMEREHEKMIQLQIENLIKYSIDNGIDMLNLWDKVYHKYPVKWQKIKINWPNMISEASFEIKANSLIRRRYSINQLVDEEID